MNVINDKTSSVFLAYAIPSVLGLLAVSSAGIIDGLFVGNFVGALGLAAINIGIPLLSLLIGAALMFAVGSSVNLGKLMGENNHFESSNIFTKSIICITLFSLFICTILIINLDTLLSLLNVEGELKQASHDYLSILLFFLPFLMVGIVLDDFVRVDENPNLAFIALSSTALVNIILDYLLIVHFELGLMGAAYATGVSYIWVVMVLFFHFFSPKATLKLCMPSGSWNVIIKALQNGFSEFINESSVGITVAIFNYVMLREFGALGVAAYTIISYIIWLSIMVSYGVGESIQPIVSKNYGANHPLRIASFLKLALSTVMCTGIIIVLVVFFFPEMLSALFLKESDQETHIIVLEYLRYIWPAFLFSGVSIVLSSYLTAIHKPLASASIALSRSLLFPALFVILLPLFFSLKGIYLAIPISEFCTLLLTLWLLKKHAPKTLL